MVFRDEIMDYKGIAFWQGERFDLKVVKYLNECKVLKHSH